MRLLSRASSDLHRFAAVARDLNLAHPRDVEFGSALAAYQKHIQILYVLGFDPLPRLNAGNGAEKHEPGERDDDKENDSD